MPASLNCPNCGAPTGEDATGCAYCGTHLATIACASCMGAMFVGSQFCPHCGAQVAAAAQGGNPALRCPGCGDEMPSQRLGGVSLHQCGKCGGQFLSPDVFATLCNDHAARGALTLASGGAAPSVAASMDARIRYVHCAKCDKVMNRVNFGRRSGIIVDVCKGHGVWFDRDELRQVLAFVDRGGLEAVRGDGADQASTAQRALGLASSTGADAARIDAAFLSIASQTDDTSPLKAFFHALFTS